MLLYTLHYISKENIIVFTAVHYFTAVHLFNRVNLQVDFVYSKYHVTKYLALLKMKHFI